MEHHLLHFSGEPSSLDDACRELGSGLALALPVEVSLQSMMLIRTFFIISLLHQSSGIVVWAGVGRSCAGLVWVLVLPQMKSLQC